ncbi:anti-sigma factor family protein [Halobacillus massiliensis]|uniref:anti-sigma factor family protein n=1 Tax=Halobacillus massiliensis TaxID=1926286 RepID=UPI0009E5CAB8|nr:zf-HC2 domain-containing protein [Halobacillus massiliensis]
MSHLREENIAAYIGDQLSEEERDLIEDHLNDCTLCFESYLEAVDRIEPSYDLSPSFTEEIFNKINKKTPKTKGKSTLVHYAIASAMTLVLMGSGIFHYVFSAFDDQQFQEQPSITEKLINESDYWKNNDELGGR